MYSTPYETEIDRAFDNERNTGNALVPSGGKLPVSFQVPTSKLLDVVIALAPGSRNLNARQRKEARTTFNQRLYNRTRPGVYLELNEKFHIAYVGQPNGHGSQHHWRIFCVEEFRTRIETLIAGSSLTVSGHQNGTSGTGNYSEEWGGLHLRSEAEKRIAQALDQAQVLFFANARGRVGLKNTVVTDTQLTGRVEADFMVFYQGRCMILEVDGQHHLEEGQTIRDYARDHALLRFGLPTVRFTGRDCLDRPQDVVSEFLTILVDSAPEIERTIAVKVTS